MSHMRNKIAKIRCGSYNKMVIVTPSNLWVILGWLL